MNWFLILTVPLGTIAIIMWLLINIRDHEELWGWLYKPITKLIHKHHQRSKR